MADADVLILGAGCAGLSLAVALGQHAPQLRVHLLEAREAYQRDRTWCFWNTEPHAFENCVSHRWNQWRVSQGPRSIVRSSQRFAYQHIPADRFYQAAVDRVAATPNQVLTMGVQVEATERTTAGTRVQTSMGAMEAPWVFDSRPRSATGAPECQSGLLQRFEGWHVRTQNYPFQPEVVGLMDFVPSPVQGRTVFFYTLPFSANEALVEATFLDAPHLPPSDAAGLLREHLAALTGGAGFEVLFTEHGCLPMSVDSQQASVGPPDGTIPIGTPGGRVKAASGYAFLRIQRQAAAIAGALGRGAAPPRSFEPGVFAWMDGVFLQALRAAPERTPAYFCRLFEATPPDRLVRFLGETASLGETAFVAASLPKLPFLAAAARFAASGRA